MVQLDQQAIIPFSDIKECIDEKSWDAEKQRWSIKNLAGTKTSGYLSFKRTVHDGQVFLCLLQMNDGQQSFYTDIGISSGISSASRRLDECGWVLIQGEKKRWAEDKMLVYAHGRIDSLDLFELCKKPQLMDRVVAHLTHVKELNAMTESRKLLLDSVASGSLLLERDQSDRLVSVRANGMCVKLSVATAKYEDKLHIFNAIKNGKGSEDPKQRTINSR